MRINSSYLLVLSFALERRFLRYNIELCRLVTISVEFENSPNPSIVTDIPPVWNGDKWLPVTFLVQCPISHFQILFSQYPANFSSQLWILEFSWQIIKFEKIFKQNSCFFCISWSIKVLQVNPANRSNNWQRPLQNKVRIK